MSALAELCIGADHWLPIRDGDPRGLAIFRRHYTYRPYRDGRRRTKWIGPGEYMALLSVSGDALFCWRRMMFPDMAGQSGVNCCVFRNEGAVRSSVLIQEADRLAWVRWPGERHYTYINPSKVQSHNPGYCFKTAGWLLCRDAAGRPLLTQEHDLLILERLP